MDLAPRPPDEDLGWMSLRAFTRSALVSASLDSAFTFLGFNAVYRSPGKSAIMIMSYISKVIVNVLT